MCLARITIQSPIVCIIYKETYAVRYNTFCVLFNGNLRAGKHGNILIDIDCSAFYSYRDIIVNRKPIFLRIDGFSAYNAKFHAKRQGRH